MEAAAIIAILSVSFAGASALIHSIFTNMSLSRCSEINCCCLHCIRDTLKGKELTEMINAAEPTENDHK
tara:strand:- start:285 stop:491 length:207 start_codon:yes stop_codon:yes gene_type:complete